MAKRDPLECAACGERFKTEQERIAHERSTHGLDRPGPSVEDVNTTDHAEERPA
jgi:hypothetical protein